MEPMIIPISDNRQVIDHLHHDNKLRAARRDDLRRAVELLDGGSVESARALLADWADVLDKTYVTAALILQARGEEILS